MVAATTCVKNRVGVPSVHPALCALARSSAAADTMPARLAQHFYRKPPQTPPIGEKSVIQSETMSKGLTMIYWGYGKGKTSSAMGVALRALGQGLRVLIVQFMKGGGKEGWQTGEQIIFDKLKAQGAPIEFVVAGKGWVKIRGDQKPFEDHEEAAQGGFAYSLQQTASGQWDFVVLDEILSAVDSMLLTVDQIKELIEAKPPKVHLLMTGHKEYPELTELADLVTKMEKVKHPYEKGVLAQKGVDF